MANDSNARLFDNPAESVNDYYAQLLKESHVKPSTVRIHVLRYLLEHRSHPTVDQIFTYLRGALPSLSKMSVYNSLDSFKEAGIIRELNMDGNETRYDAILTDHGHFRCVVCDEIYDLNMDFGAVMDQEFGDFVVHKRDALLWGTCPNCKDSDSDSDPIEAVG